MDEHELERVWTTLDPTPGQRRRIGARVSNWVEAHNTPLAAEWLAFIQVNPFASLGLAAVGVLSVITATPILWIARSMM
jgi:hypothetical protein